MPYYCIIDEPRQSQHSGEPRCAQISGVNRNTSDGGSIHWSSKLAIYVYVYIVYVYIVVGSVILGRTPQLHTHIQYIHICKFRTSMGRIPIGGALTSFPEQVQRVMNTLSHLLY